ncbi:hypothetical protein VNO77_03881 [Canavalia gladiata]|uniref:Uncharacterized protein n=1 Tax=Canavalia gladiata TaxID=3824 RepID=A0AAN9MW53_CANGL
MGNLTAHERLRLFLYAHDRWCSTMTGIAIVSPQDIPTGVAFQNKHKMVSVPVSALVLSLRFSVLLNHYVALLAYRLPSLFLHPVSVSVSISVCVKLTYDVPNTNFLKRKWLSFAGERWRGFKTHLTSKYIYGSLKDVSPCEEYQFLDEDTWQRFVESRMDPAFVEKRKKGQQISAKNFYPHRLSRGGYELLQERLMDQKSKERQQSSEADPSTLLSPPSPPSRHEKWKRARQKATGEYTSEPSRIVAEKIDYLVEQSSQGVFVPTGQDDILSTAIGQPEHPGRVRAVGRGPIGN